MPSMFGVQNKSPLVPARNAYNATPKISTPQPSLPRGGYGPSTGIGAVPPRIPQLPKPPQPTMPTGGYGPSTGWDPRGSGGMMNTGGIINSKLPSNQPTLPTGGYGPSTGIMGGMGGINPTPMPIDPVKQEELKRNMFGVNTGFTGAGPVPMM